MKLMRERKLTILPHTGKVHTAAKVFKDNSGWLNCRRCGSTSSSEWHHIHPHCHDPKTAGGYLHETTRIGVACSLQEGYTCGDLPNRTRECGISASCLFFVFLFTSSFMQPAKNTESGNDGHWKKVTVRYQVFFCRPP